MGGYVGRACACGTLTIQHPKTCSFEKQSTLARTQSTCTVLLDAGGPSRLPAHRIPMSASKTVFQKIADREIPATFVHEDELCFVIRDVSPQAPVHLLVVPKVPVPRLSASAEADAALLGHLLVTAGRIAREQD